MNFLRKLNKHNSFVNNINDVEFEKCGDVIVAPRHKIFALTCSFCHDVFMDFFEFRNHIIEGHDVYLGWSDAESASEDEVEEDIFEKEKCSIKHVEEVVGVEKKKGSIKTVEEMETVLCPAEHSPSKDNDVEMMNASINETLELKETYKTEKMQGEIKEKDTENETIDAVEQSTCQTIEKDVVKDNSPTEDVLKLMESSVVEVTETPGCHKKETIQILKNELIQESFGNGNETDNDMNEEFQSPTIEDKSSMNDNEEVDFEEPMESPTIQEKISVNVIKEVDLDEPMDVDEDNVESKEVTENVAPESMTQVQPEEEIVKSTVDEIITQKLNTENQELEPVIIKSKDVEAFPEVITSATIDNGTDIVEEAVNEDEIDEVETAVNGESELMKLKVEEIASKDNEAVRTVNEETAKEEITNAEVISYEEHTEILHNQDEAVIVAVNEKPTEKEITNVDIIIHEEQTEILDSQEEAVIPKVNEEPSEEKTTIAEGTSHEEDTEIIDNQEETEIFNKQVETKILNEPKEVESLDNEIIEAEAKKEEIKIGNAEPEELRTSNYDEELKENLPANTQTLSEDVKPVDNENMAVDTDLTSEMSEDKSIVAQKAEPMINEAAIESVDAEDKPEDNEKEIENTQMTSKMEDNELSIVEAVSKSTDVLCTKTPRTRKSLRKNQTPNVVLKSCSNDLITQENDNEAKTEFRPRRRSVRNICLPKTLIEKKSEKLPKIEEVNLVRYASKETLITDDSDMDIDDDLTSKTSLIFSTDIETITEEETDTNVDTEGTVEMEPSLQTTLEAELDTEKEIENQETSTVTEIASDLAANGLEVGDVNEEELNFDSEVAEVEVETNNVIEAHNESDTEQAAEIDNEDDIATATEESQKKTPETARLRRKSVKLAAFFEELMGDDLDLEEDEDMKVIQNLVLRTESEDGDETLNDDEGAEDQVKAQDFDEVEHKVENEKDNNDIIDEAEAVEKEIEEEENLRAEIDDVCLSGEATGNHENENVEDEDAENKNDLNENEEKVQLEENQVEEKETEDILNEKDEEIESEDIIEENVDNIETKNSQETENKPNDEGTENIINDIEEAIKNAENQVEEEIDEVEEEQKEIENILNKSKQHRIQFQDVELEDEEDHMDASLNDEQNVNEVNESLHMILQLEEDDQVLSNENANAESDKTNLSASNITLEDKTNTPTQQRNMKRRKTIGGGDTNAKTLGTIKPFLNKIQTTENDWDEIENQNENENTSTAPAQVVKKIVNSEKSSPLTPLQMNNTTTVQVRKRKAETSLDINVKKPKIYDPIIPKEKNPVKQTRNQVMPKRNPLEIPASITSRIGSSVVIQRVTNVSGASSKPTAPPKTSVTISKAMPIKVLTNTTKPIKSPSTQVMSSGNSMGVRRLNPVVRIKRLKLQTAEVDSETLKSAGFSKPPVNKTATQILATPKRSQPTSTAKTPLKASTAKPPKKIVEEEDVIDELLQQVTNEDILGTTADIDEALEEESPQFDDNDIMILQKVGLQILADPNCEKQMSPAQMKDSRNLVEQFADALDNTKLMTRNVNNNNPKYVSEIFVKLTEVVNTFLNVKSQLRLSEMKRLVYLVSRWHSHVYAAIHNTELPENVMEYFNMFYFIPNTIRHQFYCEMCSLCCLSVAKCDAHRAEHISLAKWQCEYCNRFLKSDRTLKTHMEKCKLKQ